jgi:hypothetical protein
MKMEHTTFRDSNSYLPMTLRMLHEAFGLSVTKWWYTHYFNTKQNLDYVGPTSGIEHFGGDKMSDSERREFLSCYDEQ